MTAYRLSSLDTLQCRVTKLSNTSILLTRTEPLQMRCVRFSQNVIKSLIKSGFVFTKGTLNFIELSKYTPKYLHDVIQLITDLDATTLAQTFLYFGPKRIQADFLGLMAIYICSFITFL